MGMLQDSLKTNYDKWVEEVGTEDLLPRLEIPLMVRNTYKTGVLMEMNFDKFLYRHIAEAEVWARLGKNIPDVLVKVFEKKDRLHGLRETVLLVVKDYNRIIDSLAPAEQALFKERVKMLDRKVQPGLTRLTWGADVSDSYIKDCRQAANKVQDLTNDYKQANIKIGILAWEMTKFTMIRVDTKRIFVGEEFNEFQRRHRERAILKIATKYKELTLILRSVFEMFKTDGPGRFPLISNMRLLNLE